MKEYFEGTKPKVAMVTKVTGCSSGIYMRPITGTQNQKISMGSSLLGYMLSSSAKQQVASAIKNSPGDIDNLLTKISSATTVADAYSQLTASTSGASQFASLFGTQATTLGDAAPTVDTLVMPEEGQERSALAYSVTAKHWLTSYSIVYEWQIDNVTVSTAANFTYTPALNSRGTHTISLKVGKDNGSGHVDTTKAYYSVSKSLLISINDAPTVRSLIASVNSGSYSTGQVITLTVRFSENVTVTGTPRLSLNTTPTTRVLNMTSSSGTDLVFSYTVNAGENSSALDAVSAAGLDANGGTIKDDADNNAVLALPVPGATNSISVSKTIKIDTTAPSVTISANPAAVVSSSSASFTFAATDAGTVNGYQCKVDSGSYAACSSPKTFSGLSAGAHTFYVTASDIAGNTSAAQTVSWTIDKTGPTTTISSAPAAVISSTSASLSFSAVDSGGGTVASYQCQIDGAAYATCVSPKSYTGLSQGSHTFYVRAVDSVGNTGTAVTSTWSADTVAPTVSSLQASVANGNYGYGQAMDITLTFNEIVTVTGTPQLTLNSGAVLSLTSSSGTTLTFNYVVGNGQNASALDSASTSALSLNGGTIVDQAGNAANLTLPVVGASGSISYAQTIVIDTTAPAAPNIYLTSPDLAQSTSITMTAANCSDRAYLYITESVSEVPLGSESSWQACTTTASAIRYWLLNNTVGLRPLYIWAKDAAGNISASAKTIPLKYVPKLILGQDDANTITNLQTGLYAPVDVKYFGTKFYVVNNGSSAGALSKVSVYNSIPSTTLAKPDYYIGQKVGHVVATPGTANNRVNLVSSVESDGTRFVAVDRNNNRVLIWNSIPSNGDVPADIVLGQPDFYSSAINAGLGASTNLLTCKELNSPQDVKIYGNKLVVTDGGNNRILIWNTWPTSNYQAADLVLGQASCSTYATTPVSASSLSGPSGLVMLGAKLAVSDNLNHRILIWNTFPTTNGQAADLYLGQSSFTANSSNSGGASATSLRNPRRLATDGTNLIVSDGNNHRVKIWTTFPTTNNAAANVVVGQSAMTGISANAASTASAATLNSPTGVQVIAGDLWIADNGNNRVLKYSGIPSTNGASATYVLGQQFLTKNVMSLSSGVNEQTFNRPIDTEFVGNGLYITSYGHNRMSSYSTMPSGSNPQMELQWGQADFYSDQTNRGSTATAANTLSNVSGILYVSGTLYVADSSNSRILGFTTLPSTAGTSAGFALGQANLTTGTSNGGGAVSASTLYFPRQISSDGNKFAAADSNISSDDGTHFAVADVSNGRVLLYNGDPTQNSPSVVLGQTSMTKVGCTPGGSANSSNLCDPYGVLLVPVGGGVTKLIVADYSQNRVLIWNTLPTVNNQAADVVVGQPDMSSTAANNGGRTCARLANPISIASDGTRLLIADMSNQRVLLYNTIPTSNGATADVVIGQASCTVATSATTQAGMKNPYGVHISGNQIVVADRNNNRVLLYNSIPTANTPSADYVVGQTTFTASSTGITAATMNAPWHAYIWGGKLYVADSGNNRTLIWNTVPSANGASANTVIGQANLTSNSSAYSQAGAYSPRSIWLGTSYLWTVEFTAMRVKRYPLASLATGMSADAQVGGPADYTTAGIPNIRNSALTSQSSLTQPNSAIIVGTKLIVADYRNNRILIWNTLPTSNNQNADVVLGQPSFTATTANNGGLGASTLNLPVQVASDGTRLLVSDRSNNRVLIWNTIPTVSNTAADLVLGQANFTSNTLNRGGAVAANTMNAPFGIYTDGTRLYVTDESNHRVLAWTTFPTVSGQAADFELGQAGFTTGSANRGSTVAANSLNAPRGVIEANSKLFVADMTNNRVLVWNTIPSANGTAADLAIGQASLTTNALGSSATTLSSPYHVKYLNSKLFVTDSSNRRIMIYNTIPTASGATVDSIIGQNSTGTVNINRYGVSGWAFGETIADIMYNGGYFWITDVHNHRLLKVSIP